MARLYIAGAPNVLLASALVFGCYAQPAQRLEFEAASIKPVPPFDGGRPLRMGCRGGPGTDDPVLYICENWSLANMVNMAYALGPNQLSAPDWMNRALFDISARLEKVSTWDQFMLMLQNLLADRFKLTAHYVTQQRNGYQLLLSKDGPKFKASAPSDLAPAVDSDALSHAAQPFSLDRNGYPLFARGQSGTRMSGSRGRIYEPSLTMDRLAAFISAWLHEPVANATGLDGSYEISFYWAVDALAAAPLQAEAGQPADAGPTLLQAIQQQLGLRVVRSQKVPFEVLTVDHAEKLPTPN
jgi:uncharacterized protein (TIGR03435 family)